MVNLKTILRIRDAKVGNTYDVIDTDSGKEFTIDAFPKRDVSRGDARYIVERKYGGVGSWWRNTRTLKEAKNLIRQDLLEKVV